MNKFDEWYLSDNRFMQFKKSYIKFSFIDKFKFRILFPIELILELFRIIVNSVLILIFYNKKFDKNRRMLYNIDENKLNELFRLNTIKKNMERILYIETSGYYWKQIHVLTKVQENVLNNIKGE